MRLPLPVSHAAAVNIRGTARVEGHSGSPPDQNRSMNGALPRSVLMVGGEPALAALLARALHDAGCSTSVVRDGTSALALLGEHPIDVIVVDLVAPGVLGVDVLGRLQAACERTPAVIVMTAHSAEVDRIHVRRLRAKLEADPANPDRIQAVWGGRLPLRRWPISGRVAHADYTPTVTPKVE